MKAIIRKEYKITDWMNNLYEVKVYFLGLLVYHYNKYGTK